MKTFFVLLMFAGAWTVALVLAPAEPADATGCTTPNGCLDCGTLAYTQQVSCLVVVQDSYCHCATLNNEACALDVSCDYTGAAGCNSTPNGECIENTTS